jgi:hypothetical protein
MTAYPRELSATEVSPGLAILIRGLADRLLAGRAPEHRALRDQLASSRLGRVTLTGAGLFAYFEHPVNTARVVPPEMIGGEVLMEVRGLDAPAGCLLKVSEGKMTAGKENEVSVRRASASAKRPVSQYDGLR